MAFALSVRASTWGRPVLLWSSCACALWFVIAWVLFQAGADLPRPIVIAVYLSGAIALLGVALAAVYLLLAVWLPVHWLVGLVALVVNAAFFAYFWHSIP
jgi:uncharacterized membrane protein